MQPIKVHRYTDPKGVGWAGWIEPEDKSWIAFIGLDGVPRFFLNRDPETGAICPDDPEERKRHLAELKTHKATNVLGLNIGMVNDGSSHFEPGYVSPLKIGEVVEPLGERSDPT
jgi:hypothetical protein